MGQTSLLILVEALAPAYSSVWSYAVVYAATATASPIPHPSPENTVFHHQ